MSVIAWDGKVVAADALGGTPYLTKYVQKLFVCNDHLAVGVVGLAYHMPELVHWVATGCVEKDYPSFQRGDNPSELIVFDAYMESMNYRVYRESPVPLEDSVTPVAWGGGAELAIGAMAVGASAEEAVRIACQYSPTCGIESNIVPACRIKEGKWVWI